MWMLIVSALLLGLIVGVALGILGKEQMMQQGFDSGTVTFSNKIYLVKEIKPNWIKEQLKEQGESGSNDRN